MYLNYIQIIPLYSLINLQSRLDVKFNLLTSTMSRTPRTHNHITCRTPRHLLGQCVSISPDVRGVETHRTILQFVLIKTNLWERPGRQHRPSGPGHKPNPSVFSCQKMVTTCPANGSSGAPSVDLFDRSVFQGRQTEEFYCQLVHFQESFREQLSWWKVYGRRICQWRRCGKVLLSLDRLSETFSSTKVYGHW